MLLLVLLVTIAKFDKGLSNIIEDVCYGTKYRLPARFTPPVYSQEITYTPKVGDSKIVLNNGQSLDTRFKVLLDGIEMADLTEQDNEGVLSTEGQDFVKLIVKNCGVPVKRFYGSSIFWNISNSADYLEFSKYTSSDVPAQPIVLWNHTYSNGNSSSVYEIKELTQKNSGYYRFRGSDHRLLTWDQMVVEEHVKIYVYVLGKSVYIGFPIVIVPSQVRFTRAGAERYMELENSDRVTITNQYLTVDKATNDDAGTYTFLDKDGNLFLHAVVRIKDDDDEPLHWYYIVSLTAFGLAFMGLIARCCWNEYKEKNRDPSDTVTPAVIFQALKDNLANNPTTTTA